MEKSLVDLGNISGLPLSLDPGNNKLIFGREVEEVSPTVKYVKDLKAVLMEMPQEDNRELYYAYRGVSFRKDKNLLQDHQLRYDVIVMPPGTLGQEYVKTKGHEHEKIPKTEHTYPELYLVLYGKIHYLLQRIKKNHRSDIIDEVLVIEATAGDKVVIPPDYAHFSINADDGTAVIANLVGTNFSSSYENVENLQGAAYYLIKEHAFIRNKRYRQVPDIKNVNLQDYPELGVLKGIPTYSMVARTPEVFKYLTQPADYLAELMRI